MNEQAIDYGALLEETKPEVIHGEVQNRRHIEILERLTAQETVTEAEEKLIALLTVLIEQFENHYYPVVEVGPLDVIRHLMEEHQLRQKDLVDVFRTESIVSDVLNGKRELNHNHIKRLVERFKVSPAVFY
jgi:HTH-type transcriptional regulator / antitoxin HigA